MKTLTIALMLAFGGLLGLVPAIAADAPETAPEPLRSLVASTTPSTTTEPPKRPLGVADGQSCPGWIDVAREVGWPEAELPMVGAITYFESRCQNDVRGDNGISWTAFQIHTKTWCLPSKYYPDGYMQTLGLVSTCDDLLDPATAARAALAIWQYGGWAPWTTSEMASTSLNQ